MAQITNIGLFTSGGDSPGMNAAIRAVVRAAVFHNIKITGIRRGFEGMINGDLFPMGAACLQHPQSFGLLGWNVWRKSAACGRLSLCDQGPFLLRRDHEDRDCDADTVSAMPER